MAIFDKSKKLDNEELKDVNGGYIYDTKSFFFDENGYGHYKYEVIDDVTGEVLYNAESYQEAFLYAGQRAISWDEISLDQLNRLRETGSIN